jgi:anti-sigma factor RsiW
METPLINAEEVGRILKVRLPTLPAGWRVIDAQVFPTDVGPSINVVLETAELKRLDLFAVRANTFDEGRPEIASRRGQAVAFWEEGESAYVLSGAAKPEELLRQATALKQRASL